jgi:hypothetical protein
MLNLGARVNPACVSIVCYLLADAATAIDTNIAAAIYRMMTVITRNSSRACLVGLLLLSRTFTVTDKISMYTLWSFSRIQ